MWKSGDAHEKHVSSFLVLQRALPVSCWTSFFGRNSNTRFVTRAGAGAGAADDCRCCCYFLLAAAGVDDDGGD